MLCAGLRKLNCGRESAREHRHAFFYGLRACAFVCSLLVRPVRKLLPLRATN